MTAMTNNIISVDCNNSTLIIKYPDIDYRYWKGLIPYEDDLDIIIILKNLLVNLDIRITFDDQRLLYTNQMMYEKYISDYYYYLIHFTNQYYYNIYFNLLIATHEINIQFELDNPIIEKPINPIKSKSRDFSKMKAKPKFIRQITNDLITGEEVYKYIDNKTGEVITSNDPDLLNNLNSKPKKEKKIKSIGVPVNMMTFSFKKKE